MTVKTRMSVCVLDRFNEFTQKQTLVAQRVRLCLLRDSRRNICVECEKANTLKRTYFIIENRTLQRKSFELIIFITQLKLFPQTVFKIASEG